MTESRGLPAAAPDSGALAVFKNRSFLFLWLAQAFTQIGGNMVIFGLTIIIAGSTNSTTAVSALILTFLVPAVLFSALAGVFIDRLDKRLVLIVTNVLRGAAFVAIFFVGDNLAALYLLGPITIRTFTLALLIGVISGTYSSIFNASQLLVSWYEWDANRKSRPAGTGKTVKPLSR